MMKRSLYLLACALLAVTVAGCSSEDNSSAAPDSGSTSSPALSTAAAPDTTTPPTDDAPSVSVPTNNTPVVSAPAGGGGSNAPAVGSPTGADKPIGDLNRDDANVDASQYAQGDTVYFQSPSGSYTCAVRPEQSNLTGCFGPLNPVPSQLANCQTLNSASITIGGYLCQTQGVMTPPSPAKVLPYGSIMLVRGVFCTSKPSGIACDDNGHGFSVSRESNSVY